MCGKGGMHGKGGTCVVKGGDGALQGGAVRRRRDGHCSGRYASYWNAFLLNYQIT